MKVTLCISSHNCNTSLYFDGRLAVVVLVDYILPFIGEVVRGQEPETSQVVVVM